MSAENTKVKVIIYGAKEIGKFVLAQYYGYRHQLAMLCFAVSRKEDNPDDIHGIPVYEIADLAEKHKDAIVIVSVSEKYRHEMENNARQLGFFDVWYYEENSKNSKMLAGLDRGMYKDVVADWYRLFTGWEFDWNRLRTYNEKLQWLKIYDHVEEKSSLADKYKVREYVMDKIGSEHLIPLLGCWEKTEDICFDELPDEFVLKCNHGSGWNIIIHDKKNIDMEQIYRKLNEWMETNYAYISGYELPYMYIRPMIIAEEMLHADGDEELRDYKIFVFQGKAKIIQVDIDRSQYHRRNLYTCDWKYIPEGIGYPMASDVVVEKPECLEELVGLAEKLGAGFRHVRVDFYIVKNHIYFGEMTFSHGSGTESFTSESFALEMGNWIELDGEDDNE